MKRRVRPFEGLSHEFELDLAPLLAVMVKLVPVLIVSSAFVPIVIIQSELPAPVAAAVSEAKPSELPQMELQIHPTQGMQMKLTQGGKTLSELKMKYPNSDADYKGLQESLARFKRQAPQLFRLDLLPQGNVPYDTIVKIIDAARKSPSINEKFKFTNPQSGTLEETEYMYPDVVFANTLEG
jgi:biopolymer transport protein ExbD